MSLESELAPRAPGSLPTAFEVLHAASTEKDWQTRSPTTEEARRWYRVGYYIADDREISEPVSPIVPESFRYWWARGLMDAKLGRPSLLTPPDAPQPDDSSILPAVLGAVASVAGLGLLAWSGLRRRTP